MIRAALFGKGHDNLVKALSENLDFKTSGALSGVRYGDHKPTMWDSGRLANEDLGAFKLDRESMTYVVYSYGTPIAWKTNDGVIHNVKQRFSVTTSKHQGKMYLFK